MPPDITFGLGAQSASVHVDVAVEAAGGILAPTHPSQVGLTAIGRDRDTYAWPNIYPASTTLGPEVNGTVIEDTRFDGAIQLDGVNTLTLRRCWLRGNTLYGIRRLSAGDALNITLEDCDLGAWAKSNNIDQGTFWFLEGISVVRRCLVYNCEDGAKLAGGSETHVEDSWIQCVRPDVDAHADCLQFNDFTKGKVFVKRTTLDPRSWQDSSLTRLHHQQELSGITVTREHAGNAVLQTKPCGNDMCTEPQPGVFYSIVDSIVCGGNYIMTAENQAGEFLRNTIIRGSANPGVDQGIRNKTNILIPSSGPDVNRFHDNGEIYLGGKVNPNGEPDPGPIPFLGLAA